MTGYWIAIGVLYPTRLRISRFVICSVAYAGDKEPERKLAVKYIILS